MLCVGNNTFTTLPSYSVNLVCHLPLHRGGLRTVGTPVPTRCKIYALPNSLQNGGTKAPPYTYPATPTQTKKHAPPGAC